MSGSNIKTDRSNLAIVDNFIDASLSGNVETITIVNCTLLNQGKYV